MESRAEGNNSCRGSEGEIHGKMNRESENIYAQQVTNGNND